MDRLASTLSARGLEGQPTPHFVAFGRTATEGGVVILHCLDERTVDEDLPGMLADELGPLGLLNASEDFGCAMNAIITSACSTRSPLEAWSRYSRNSLERLRALVDQVPGAVAQSHIGQFAAIYRRVLELGVGSSFLDVGTSLGFLPVLVAERVPGVRVVGVDNRQEVMPVAADLATGASTQVEFRVGDVLDPGFGRREAFDTVTAVHLIEHLNEDQMLRAVGHLLTVTAGRLIVAVPFEDERQTLHGHAQLFTPAMLRELGGWFVERLGARRFWCEDVSGGLLVVDRVAVPQSSWAAQERVAASLRR